MATVSSVYANALFEVAREKGKDAEFFQQLKDVTETCFGEPTLRSVLTAPGIDPAARKRIVADVLSKISVAGVVARLMEILAERGRVAALPEILAEYERAIEGAKGVKHGEVRSAVELSQEELNTLKDALSKRMGFGVKLTAAVDPSLLGGVVATVAGKTFDGSLRTQLEKFKNELI